MPINRNILIAAVGALCVVVAILGYKVYEDNREPKGVQVNIGPSGITVEKKIIGGIVFALSRFCVYGFN